MEKMILWVQENVESFNIEINDGFTTIDLYDTLDNQVIVISGYEYDDYDYAYIMETDDNVELKTDDIDELIAEVEKWYYILC